MLLGITGSGKTFTIANVIHETQRPTLIIAPNKTLAAQLWGEGFRTQFAGVRRQVRLHRRMCLAAVSSR